jgi:hypothetical protein
MKKLVLLILLTATNLAHATNIVLSKSIKTKLSERIESDLNLLNNFKFKNADPETLKMLGLSALTAETAAQWLEERVSYIVEENALSFFKLRLKKVISIERENVTFPNQKIQPFSLTDTLTEDNTSEGHGVTIMSNLGAAIYLGGKSERKVYNIKVSRGLLKKSLKIAVESPRAGIIQVGEGLFSVDYTINNANPASLANSINRLSAFFHEARHSDGNGKSLTFAHAICPPGHDLENLPACDEGLNGPYAIETAIVKEMIKSNENTLTEREKETLTLIMLDHQNRILTTTNQGRPATNWDPTPESL